MKLIFSMFGRAVGDAGAREQRVHGPAALVDARRRSTPARARLTWIAFTPGERDLGEVHHDDLGPRVLHELGDGRAHTGGTTDHEDPLAVVAKGTEQ